MCVCVCVCVCVRVCVCVCVSKKDREHSEDFGKFYLFVCGYPKYSIGWINQFIHQLADHFQCVTKYFPHLSKSLHLGKSNLIFISIFLL